MSITAQDSKYVDWRGVALSPLGSGRQMRPSIVFEDTTNRAALEMSNHFP
jgi:hypothetical protein